MSNWTIGRRLASACAVPMVLLLVMAGLSYRSTSELVFLADVSRAASDGNLFMVERHADHLNWVHELELHLLGAREFTGQLDHTKCKLGEWLHNTQIRQAVTDNRLQGLLAQLEDPHERVHASARKIVDAKRSGNEQAAREAFLNLTLPALKTTTEALSGIRERYQTIRREQGGKAAEDLSQHASQERTVLVVIASVALALAAGMCLVIGRSTRKDLGNAIGQLSDASQQVASAAAQVSTSSQALAQGASEQAASIEETSASTEEITSMTRKNAENSRAAAEQMVEAARIVADANQQLGLMVASMQEINASSDKISKIIKTIDEIAFQTNILALNAAVEAARAGEAGMGFAVVADEVRNLAQRSAQAAKDTAALIEESIERTGEGSTKLEKVAGAIRSITASAEKVKVLVDEVKVGSEEQARGIEQIAKAITQMEQVTQKSAANAEESASAGEEMSAQAQTLSAVVEQLGAMVGGAVAYSQGAGPTPRAALPARRAARVAVPSGSLGALRKAVTPRSAEPPVVAAAKKGRQEFPLDEEFKEF